MKSTKIYLSENPIFKRREPYQFMLNLGIFGISFVFFVLTVIDIIQKTRIGWNGFKLPEVFWFSTIVLLFSSLTLHQANKAFCKEKFVQYRSLIGATLLLGIIFMILQLLGWLILLQSGIYLQNSRSGAFLYIISGLHLAHIFAGLFLLIILFRQAFQHTSYIDAFIYSVNPPNQLRLKLISRYWHFVDILWIYLFLFFLYQQLY